MDEKLPYDVILAETDPVAVKMEIDLYWIAKAGQDPWNISEEPPGGPFSAGAYQGYGYNAQTILY